MEVIGNETVCQKNREIQSQRCGRNVILPGRTDKRRLGGF